MPKCSNHERQSPIRRQQTLGISWQVQRRRRHAPATAIRSISAAAAECAGVPQGWRSAARSLCDEAADACLLVG